MNKRNHKYFNRVRFLYHIKNEVILVNSITAILVIEKRNI